MARRQRYEPRPTQISWPANEAGWSDVNFLRAVYDGSDGDATAMLYRCLEMHGAPGVVALNVFRAVKNSERAKQYRGGNGHGSYRSLAYERKQYSIEMLCKELRNNPIIPYGWATDPRQEFHNQVLYVDLPTGQVSFHTALRCEGPEYAGVWDGSGGEAPGRICRWISEIFEVQHREESKCETK